jgi:superfamily II DNA or RNA helicase
LKFADRVMNHYAAQGELWGMPAASEFQSKTLRRESRPQEYQLYRAGLEWDLTDPIVLESEKDFKSRPRWRDRLEPYQHQVTNLITFCRRLPVTLLADDVGLGKTISAGLIISELAARARLSKVLIVCPKLLGPQWKEELVSKFDIPSEIAIGRDLLTAEPNDIGTVITTYNSARLYLDELPEERFQMLILDEAHKLRNLYGVDRTPQIAKCFKKALEERRFRFVLMLTATPIQNRLWDLYSLIDLLTVARGHENPFGNEVAFVKRFIADQRQQARQLKPESREEFRSIVYGYMSRVRRGDAKLYFPDRVVQMHRVDPTEAELELIKVIAKPIQQLGPLAQISILQALTSSPDALTAQLANMARNDTAPQTLADTVKSIVSRMPPSAKLSGLGILIERLKKEDAERWRLVVFTGRRETQTAIQEFLERLGLKVGIINGDSGPRNQETIARFRQDPPDYRVIVSTEAGSEGVNLQVANVLINYDLPWNPMIVEQRIGRIQRLASDHAHVIIFNIMLRGTFEEYVVGRLMEKLQMASHAIGDIEALLQGSDIGDGEDDAAKGFEEKILGLVLAALAGKDVEEATKLAERSIVQAKDQLEKEEANINAMLGSMDDTECSGPAAPELPSPTRSMTPRQFTLAAFDTLGVAVTPKPQGLYFAEEKGAREYIRFEEDTAPEVQSTLYAPGSVAFQKLVDRVIATGVHRVADLDDNPRKRVEEIARKWAHDLGAKIKGVQIERVHRSFNGKALLRVRATVAHDSYERLVDVACPGEDHTTSGGRSQLAPLADRIEHPKAIGVDAKKLAEAASINEAMSKFSRFYLDRRAEETKAAGTDARKRRKLSDEFTPRMQVTLVGLDGTMHRRIESKVRYGFDSETDYEGSLTIVPNRNELVDGPDLVVCAQSGREVPRACLARCEISGAEALRHLLVKSEISGRLALPKFGVSCGLSGQQILNDEAEESAVTGKLIARSLLKTSALSGKRAEPAYFGVCGFTDAEVLKTELATSEISGKPYRKDEQMQSAVSGYTGHKDEFVLCHETGQAVAKREAEQCEVSGKHVRPGVLGVCGVTNKRVLPSELDRCAVTGKSALKELLVTSSVSQQRMLEDVAVRSSTGVFCAPVETKICFWSARNCHPDDVRTCGLTGLPIHVEFATADALPRLRPLTELLDGIRHTTDETALWDSVGTRVATALRRGKCRIEGAVRSPARRHLATCSEIRTMMGMRVRQIGSIYDIDRNTIVGRLAVGKRGSKNWVEH